MWGDPFKVDIWALGVLILRASKVGEGHIVELNGRPGIGHRTLDSGLDGHRTADVHRQLFEYRESDEG